MTLHDVQLPESGGFGLDVTPQDLVVVEGVGRGGGRWAP